MGKLRVLVTGASGFIGRNVYESLMQRGEVEVVGLAHRRAHDRMRSVDLTDRKSVAEVVRDVDVIVHAAAVSSGAHDIVNCPEMHVAENNIINTLLFQAAHEHGVRHVIFLSSGVVYPQTTERCIFSESDVDLNVGPFLNYFGVGWMKIYAEKLAEFYARLGRTHYTVIRPSNVYGPYDKFDLVHSHVFGATVAKVMTTEDGDSITVWGDGSEERDLVYVEDICNFITSVIYGVVQGIESAPYDVVNVASGGAVSVAELIAKIIAVSEKKIAVTYDRSKVSIPTKVVFDITKARERYGWFPRVSLESGIEKTLAWYQKTYR